MLACLPFGVLCDGVGVGWNGHGDSGGLGWLVGEGREEGGNNHYMLGSSPSAHAWA